MRRSRALTAAAAAACLGGLTLLGPTATAVTNPWQFLPLPGTAYDQVTAEWDTPFVVPKNYTQTLVSDETTLDIYPDGVDDLTDMNTVNETGLRKGRYLFRTHEVGENGAVSIVDTKTGESKVLLQRADWRRLDGIRWTPWGTLLFAEETTGGRLFEAFFDRNDPTVVTRVEERTDVGILRHEGIEALANGTVYVIDELNGGSVYRFVPSIPGDLSSGQLFALKIRGLTDAQQLWSQDTFTQKVGRFEWVPLDMDQVRIDADVASNAVAATEFGRPEDVEYIDGVLYVANTSEDRVIAVDLKRKKVSGFVEAGVNVPVEDAATSTSGFNGPDNLAQGPDGRLWVVEDNFASDIYAAGLDKNGDGRADRVNLFASLKDPGAEGTGIYFTPGGTLLVNVQHADKPLTDGTWAITRR